MLKSSHWPPFEPASEFRIGYHEDHGGLFRYHFELKLLLYVFRVVPPGLGPFWDQGLFVFREKAAAISKKKIHYKKIGVLTWLKNLLKR
jgi:hypothetical protein